MTKKFFLLTLFIILINVLYLFTGVWWWVVDLVGQVVEVETLVGILLSWAIYTLTLVITAWLSSLMVKLTLDPPGQFQKFFLWAFITVIVVIPMFYFNFGPGTKLCFETADCVGAKFDCCLSCDIPRGVVSFHYRNFRRRLNLCFLSSRGNCSPAVCRWSSLSELPRYACKEHRCVME